MNCYNSVWITPVIVGLHLNLLSLKLYDPFNAINMICHVSTQISPLKKVQLGWMLASRAFHTSVIQYDTIRCDKKKLRSIITQTHTVHTFKSWYLPKPHGYYMWIPCLDFPANGKISPGNKIVIPSWMPICQRVNCPVSQCIGHWPETGHSLGVSWR